MILDLQEGMGLCLSFQPWSATLVATKPTTKQKPKNRSLTTAIGKQSSTLTHSYNPWILAVLFKNGSTVGGPPTSTPLEPRNSYGFLLILLRLRVSSWTVRIRWGGGGGGGGSEGRRGEERSESAIGFGVWESETDSDSDSDSEGKGKGQTTVNGKGR